MIDANYPALSRAVTNSLLWQAGSAAATIVEASWRSSMIARLITAVAPLRNLRVIALILAVALAISLGVQSVVPLYVRPGLPVFWPLLLLALLIVMAAWPSPFERAWQRSLLARLLAPPHDQ